MFDIGDLSFSYSVNLYGPTNTPKPRLLKHVAKKLQHISEKITFPGLSFKLNTYRLWKNYSKFRRWSFMNSLSTMMRSRYTKHVSQESPLNTSTIFIGLPKISDHMQRPSGIIVNWQPPIPIGKAVFSRLLGSRPIFQYPLLRSKVEKIPQPTDVSSVSPISGKG